MAAPWLRPSPGIVGREREKRLLASLSGAAPDRGAALMLWGEPGVGKTSLLDDSAHHTDCRVLRIQGAESEAILPYAALADLLLPIQQYFAEIPKVQREALEACLALSGKPSVSPYPACIGALNVLSAAGQERPTLLLADDLHWMDPSSQQALLFVARRLSSERLAIVLTLREEHRELGARSGLPMVEVPPLSRAECAELLAVRNLDVAPSVCDRLVEISGGNPLALLEAASGLSTAQLRGGQPMPHLPSLGCELERAWSLRIGLLSAETRKALTLLAASHSSTAGALQPALAIQGLPLAALSPAEQAGLVIQTVDGLEFCHPVLRAVALRQAPLEQRLGAFRALAEASSGTLRAWYMAAASTGPDEEAVRALVEAATEARHRSAFGESAVAWRRAAELTSQPDLRAERLHQAAADAFIGGASFRMAWCDEALHLTEDLRTRSDIELLRGRVHIWQGEPSEAHRLLVEAAELIRGKDPARASVLLAEAASAAVMAARIGAAAEAAEEAAALVGAPGDWISTVILGLVRIMQGSVSEGKSLLRAAAPALASADPIRHQQLLILSAQAWNTAEDRREGARLLDVVIKAAAQHSAPAALAPALAMRSELETWAGRWSAAYADAEESLRWSEELRQISCIGYSLACLARLDAVRGQLADCEERVDRARAEAGSHHIGCLETYLTSALGLAALTRGDHAMAVEQLEKAFDETHRAELGNPIVVPFAADLAEAQIRTGNISRAVEVVSWLEERARGTGLAWPVATSARCRGLLAQTAEEAETHFKAAVCTHELTDVPFEHARTLLCRGEVLRRFRQPTAAREPLLAALKMFESLGAGPWVRRASVELAAAGMLPGNRRVPSGPRLVDRLTSQELQVARAVARGLSNTEAAVSLFVSRKTVEAHLTRVYRKLSVRSRTELTRALTEAGLAN
ncbi:AAA family ATPase [Streptomyces flaveus]|uniref:AAA family ATPase n=1 Tax=Streptomyces flaveus TaxID=66370 RepID=UPI001FEAB0A2|nr:helix-turn-helix transcriptional regulator [Streptomyces flaveus]